MVTTSLIGGMGNQMFQISATIGYAAKHDMSYWIPTNTVAPHVWKAHFSHFPKRPFPSASYKRHHEPSHAYSEIPYFENVELSGYFQSEKYFAEYRKEILTAFQVPWQKLEGYVSIHVRRGDYLQFPDKHPVVSQEYLYAAVKEFLDRGYMNFMVCSDDLKWCKEVFQNWPGIYQYSSNRSAIEDLALMSCCEHNICSNSTFSWWGAWLNQNENKIVIFPSVWFGPGNGHLETKDIYPEKCLIL